MEETRQFIRIGTAGWAIRSEHRPHFRPGESVLARYATRLNAVEINSSFYRPHRMATYARWAASVPRDFRFAVKAPRLITHELRLCGAEAALERFLGEAGALGTRLGPLLFQLPPSFAFALAPLREFFTALRARFAGALVCEPRHSSWFTEEADALLRSFGIARAAVDPALARRAETPGGWEGLVYYRLHGSPRMYYANYEEPALRCLAATLSQIAVSGRETWCMFDNTALGHATANALEMLEHVDTLDFFAGAAG